MKRNVPRGLSAEILASLLDEKVDDTSFSVALTCLGYCAYYRGDEGEEGCGGLAAVRRGIKAGLIGPTQISRLVGLPPGPARKHGSLMEEMCGRCSYLEDGCDFMSGSPPPDATPCGGYRLLLALMDKGALTEEEVGRLMQDAARSALHAE